MKSAEPTNAARPTLRGRQLWRRLPWVAAVLTLLIMLSSAFPAAPLLDASTLRPVAEVFLVLSPAYLLLAPVCDLFDTLSLMSIFQHVAIVCTLLVLFVAWRVWRGVHRGTGWGRELRAALIGGVTLFAVYAAALLVPRPMAALAVSSPFTNLMLIVDFHSHTKFSHDGASWFSTEANREWHARAGFDAAFITDHRTTQGAALGVAANPASAGEGTMLLQGLEVVWAGAHVNILGAERKYKGLVDASLRDMDDTTLALASMIPGQEPVILFTFPDTLANLHVAHGPGTAGVRGLELVDGSPRGLSQTRRLRPTLVALADSLHLALVSGTDIHGWGSAVPAWTLLRIPGWRGMNSDALADAISAAIRTRGVDATRVIERRVAYTEGNIGTLMATVPMVGWRMLTTLSNNERVSWIIWIWLVVAVRFAWRRRTPRPSVTTD